MLTARGALDVLSAARSVEKWGTQNDRVCGIANQMHQADLMEDRAWMACLSPQCYDDKGQCIASEEGRGSSLV
jgi:hypothetical protein